MRNLRGSTLTKVTRIAGNRAGILVPNTHDFNHYSKLWNNLK